MEQFNRHTATAILSASLASIDYTRGVLDAMGHGNLAVRLQFAAQDMRKTDERFRAAVAAQDDGENVTFESLLNEPDTTARQAAAAARADLDNVFAEVTALQAQAREWLYANVGYDDVGA